MNYAAFLRAINVGTHNRITMERLRAICAGAGFAEPSTYLQTGNVVFGADGTPEELAERLEEALMAEGLRNAAVMVRRMDDLRELVASAPFARFPDSNCLVTFVRRPLETGLALEALGASVVAVRPDEVLFAMPPGPTTSRAMAGLEKLLRGNPSTTRYWRVVEGPVGRVER